MGYMVSIRWLRTSHAEYSAKTVFTGIGLKTLFYYPSLAFISLSILSNKALIIKVISNALFSRPIHVII